MAKLSTLLGRWRRVARDVEVYSSADPKLIAQRFKNKAKGRLLAKLRFWRW
jgi:hypothetical protein